MQTFKPGMTRADLLKVFMEEGGISKRTWRRYVYRRYGYIKVDVVCTGWGSLPVSVKAGRPDHENLEAVAGVGGDGLGRFLRKAVLTHPPLHQRTPHIDLAASPSRC